jgi:putative MATE family efflux protein
MGQPDTKLRNDYTEGSITGSIVKMGLPSMVGFLSQHIYHLVDTWWISRLPEKEAGVAALTFFGSIMWVLFTFNQLVGPGSVAIISRRYGEKEYDLTEKAIKEAILLKLFFGFILGISGYFLVEKMLIAIGAPDRSLEMGIEYGRIILLGMPILYSTYTIFTAMRGVANPQMALGMMLLANILNIILDPLFMFGYLGLPAMGIKGAAVASLISFSIAFFTGLILFYANVTNVKLSLRGKYSISIRSMFTMLKIGVPNWLGDLFFSGARMVITRMVAPFGTAVVAAYGVGNQISSFGISVLIGIGLGLSALIGHNVGSGKVERAKKIGDQAILIAVGIMTVFGLATFVFAGDIIGIFFDSPDTISYGRIMMRVLALGFPFVGVFIMIEQIHLGVGLNTPTMVFNMIHAWILEVIPVYFFTVHFGFSEVTIWWTIVGAIFIISMMYYTYYQRGRWLTYKV